MIKVILDTLASLGRIMYYGKGLCRCVKEIGIIYVRYANSTGWSLWSHDPKDKDIDEF